VSDTVISVENVSKQYRLGEVGTGTLSHDLNRWWHKLRGKEDPYLRVGEANDRTTKGASEYVWSLRDINFEVKRGEVLGIIGRNGAGKSTLLKILSRVTTPTTGQIKIKGRVASLLEVGTGFNPELTGRDNIYLNGAILGMRKREIDQKFDEIVDFSGVERYIDTPVKRYSSGMYVRLAFAVAAHLEPEILIVDEVLAVGDAEFQAKCLGKMQDVAGNGRTVLFVSHNMAVVGKLCSQAVYMSKGTVKSIGSPAALIQAYLGENAKQDGSVSLLNLKSPDGKFTLQSVEILNARNEGASTLPNTSGFSVRITYALTEAHPQLRVGLRLHSYDGTTVLMSTNWDLASGPSMGCTAGTHSVKVGFPANFLNQGRYYVSVGADIPKVRAVLNAVEQVASFSVETLDVEGGRPGVTAPMLVWQPE